MIKCDDAGTLEELDLSSTLVTSQTVDALASCEHLKSVRVNFCSSLTFEVSRRVVEHPLLIASLQSALALVRSCPKLRLLALYGCRNVSSMQVAQLSAANTRLKVLSDS